MREVGERPETDALGDARARARLTFDLSETARRMMAMNLRRRNPTATEEEIERRLVEWTMTRPGAEHGDAEGRPIDVARFSR